MESIYNRKAIGDSDLCDAEFVASTKILEGTPC
jgi:hypothetical protein